VLAIIKNDKIVSGALVFIESVFHFILTALCKIVFTKLLQFIEYY
jgi:hypothetical protein